GDVDHLVPLTMQSYKPAGSTALFDALGDTLSALLGTPNIYSAATATLVTLFTDGQENSSSRYDSAVLSEVIKRLEATGRWTFALIGPTQGVSSLAEMLHVPQGNVQGYDPSSVAERTQVFG